MDLRGPGTLAGSLGNGLEFRVNDIEQGIRLCNGADYIEIGALAFSQHLEGAAFAIKQVSRGHDNPWLGSLREGRGGASQECNGRG